MVYDDRTFRLWREEREIEEDEFRSRLTHIAGSSEAFKEMVEEEFMIDLDAYDLSSAQQNIIETAINEGEYTESGSTSPALNELIRLLQDEASQAKPLIKYEGEYYTWNYWHSD